MFTATSDFAASQVDPARRLDALFREQGLTSIAEPAVSADLAALLDREVAAIATGNQAAAGPRSPRPANWGHVSTGRAPSEDLTGDIPIDIAPPGARAVTDQPAVQADGRDGAAAPPGDGALLALSRVGMTSDRATPASSGSALLPPEPALPMPRRRIGAIVIETSGPPAPARTLDGPPAGRAALGPGEPVEVGPMPSPRQLTDEQRAAILASIDPEWLKALHAEIDDLYKQVTGDFASPPANSEQMLKMLREARQTLIENPEEYVSAEYRTSEVKAMLERMRKCRREGKRYGAGILFYELLWAALVLAGLVMATPLMAAIARLGSINQSTGANLYPFWSTMMWGGLGGVIGALYMLWWHVADRQDFDGQYTLWYLVQPLMGLVLGGIMFLVLAGGFLVVQVDLTNPQAATAGHILPYLVAVLAGFRQNWVYEQLNRLMALFTPAAQGTQTGGSNGLG
jgi:hypothetical protein